MKLEQSQIEDIYDGVNGDKKEILKLYLLVPVAIILGVIAILCLLVIIYLNRSGQGYTHQSRAVAPHHTRTAEILTNSDRTAPGSIKTDKYRTESHREVSGPSDAWVPGSGNRKPIERVWIDC